MVRKRRIAVIALAGLALVAGLVLLVSGRPSGERYALDDTLPDGAVVRIGSRLFGPVRGDSRGAMDISPDGTRVFTVDGGAWLCAWDAERGAPLWRVRLQEPRPEGGVERLAYESRRNFDDDDNVLRGVAASPDGTRVAARMGAWIVVYDAATGAFVADRHAARPTEEAPPIWSADGSALWFIDGTAVTVWDVGGGSRSAKTDGEHVSLLGTTADGGAVVSWWEPSPARHVAARVSRDGAWTVQRDITGGAAAAVLLPDGRVVTHHLTPENKLVRMWLDLGTGAVEEELPPRNGHSLYGAAGARLDWGWDHVDLVDAPGAAPRTITRGGPGAMRLSADGRRVAVSEAGRVRLFAAPGGAPLRADDILPVPEHFVVHPDGRRVFAAAADGKVLEIEIPSGRVLRTFDVAPGPWCRLVLSPDGRFLAGSTAGTFRVDVGSGTVDAWKRWAGSTIVLRDGRVLVLTSVKGAGWALLDCATDEHIVLAGAAGTGIGAFRSSADGRIVSADVNSGTPGVAAVHKVWDTATGAEVAAPPASDPPQRLGAPAPCPTEIDFGNAAWLGPSADAPRRVLGIAEKLRLGRPRASDVIESVVALATDDGGVAIVSTADGRVLRRLRADGDGAIVRVALVPGGRWLVSGHETGCLMVWDLGAAQR